MKTKRKPRQWWMVPWRGHDFRRADLFATLREAQEWKMEEEEVLRVAVVLPKSKRKAKR